MLPLPHPRLPSFLSRRGSVREELWASRVIQEYCSYFSPSEDKLNDRLYVPQWRFSFPRSRLSLDLPWIYFRGYQNGTKQVFRFDQCSGHLQIGFVTSSQSTFSFYDNKSRNVQNVKKRQRGASGAGVSLGPLRVEPLQTRQETLF